MRRVLPPLLLLFGLTARAAPNGCLPAEHDPITAREVAAALPGFARIDPDTPIAAAPGPGVRRVIRPLELISIARNHAVQLDAPEELCFELPMMALDRSRVLDAMRAALPFPETRIEITETSLYPVPRGRIEFRREDLGAPALANAPTPVIWRGNVVYGSNQRFAIWAHVIVTARLTRLIATEPIRRGSLIGANQVRPESTRGFPVSTDLASSLDQVVGRVATRPIAAGAEIRVSSVERPQDVRRGDIVEIEVRSGAAHVALTAKSESDGRIGDPIAVRNLRSNKIFQARVEGKDRAFVDAALPEGN
ncbi:MAG TPA: flagellar basal body P-ring formation chaperone FlgA [Bryobacteraceae bacterium]|nr:flagellar basal body P-ring formation chaperone FlgA [Bryobacteraceae bacterium]